MENIIFISDKKIRIDYLIKSYCKDLTWKQIYNYIENKLVSVNNNIVNKKSTLVLPNQVVVIKSNYNDNLLVNKQFVTEDKKYYDIVDENKYFVVVNKYPCINTVSSNITDISLFNLLENNLNQKLFLVHRLDKDTRGLIVFAKDLITQNKFNILFKSRKINKYYYAICVSKKPKTNGLIESYLKNTYKLKKVIIENNGKYALTKFNILKSNNDIHLYDIQIFTGRTHQIRVHMSNLDMPILGDVVYGNNIFNKKYNCFVQQLQSYRLVFNFNNKTYDFKLPYQLDYNFF